MSLPQTFQFTTGSMHLPDVGELSYNTCKFSPMFESNLSVVFVKTDDGRATKYAEITLEAEGYVTVSGNDVSSGASISPTMVGLARKLAAQGGTLTYKGRGCDMSINSGGVLNFTGLNGSSISTSDVAWGPVPDLMDFQPLGGGLSAKVKWQVKVRVPISVGGTLLQFATETSVGYGEDGYSSLTVRGVMEVPLTRPANFVRSTASTVDDLRFQLDARVLDGIDLSKFRVTRRDFHVSKDKRTLTFDFGVEEVPYMMMPADCTVARGSYSVRPAKAGMGLVVWLCSLRATYTIRKDRPRRTAWDAFLLLLRERMAQSEVGVIPNMNGNQNPGPVASLLRRVQQLVNVVASPTNGSLLTILQELRAQNAAAQASRKSWLIDFSFDEGLYLDSKVITFSASWRLTVSFAYILQASGLWAKVPERTPAEGEAGNLWATSMRPVQGYRSWLYNQLDPTQDVVVDFGGG